MYISSPNCHTPIVKTSKFSRQFENAALQDILNKALQAPKEIPDVYWKTFFNTTSFLSLHVHLVKIFSPQLNYQTDSDSINNTLIFHFLT